MLTSMKLRRQAGNDVVRLRAFTSLAALGNFEQDLGKLDSFPDLEKFYLSILFRVYSTGES